jgi:hypothetical protein
MRTITACLTLVMSDRRWGCKSYKDSFRFFSSRPELAAAALSRFAAAGLLDRSRHRQFHNRRARGLANLCQASLPSLVR